MNWARTGEETSEMEWEGPSRLMGGGEDRGRDAWLEA